MVEDYRIILLMISLPNYHRPSTLQIERLDVVRINIILLRCGARIVDKSIFL